jgi:hypothetical protein
MIQHLKVMKNCRQTVENYTTLRLNGRLINQYHNQFHMTQTDAEREKKGSVYEPDDVLSSMNPTEKRTRFHKNKKKKKFSANPFSSFFSVFITTSSPFHRMLFCSRMECSIKILY